MAIKKKVDDVDDNVIINEKDLFNVNCEINVIGSVSHSTTITQTLLRKQNIIGDYNLISKLNN